MYEFVHIPVAARTLLFLAENEHARVISGNRAMQPLRASQRAIAKSLTVDLSASQIATIYAMQRLFLMSWIYS